MYCWWPGQRPPRPAGWRVPCEDRRTTARRPLPITDSFDKLLRRSGGRCHRSTLLLARQAHTRPPHRAEWSTLIYKPPKGAKQYVQCWPRRPRLCRHGNANTQHRSFSGWYSYGNNLIIRRKKCDAPICVLSGSVKELPRCISMADERGCSNILHPHT